MNSRSTELTGNSRPSFASQLYRLRWPLSFLTVALVAGLFGSGMSQVAWFSSSVAGLGGDAAAAAEAPPMVFDPAMDVWFGEQDASVNTFYEIENRFVAEDYVMVTLEETDNELGVFSPKALATISRLTEQFLTVPGVRHVRSLTYNPWIRWGTIQDEGGSEEGLIISDLVEGDPSDHTESEVLERMVAILGAQRVADRLGEERVREVLGADADFSEFIGEPLLLGTILNEAGNTTVIQIQVLRPRVDQELLRETFGDNAVALKAAPNLYSVATQRKSLNGIEHILRLEQGLAVPTEHYMSLVAYVDGLPDGEAKQAAQLELDDPRQNNLAAADGVRVPKFRDYDLIDGTYIDLHTGEAAPAGFKPVPLSDFTYRVGGSPIFERNFETVGMGDAKYIPLMFLVIILCLYGVFRTAAGVIIPLAVVFGSILAMVGGNFSTGALMNNLTMMSPNMLTAVGIADAIHLVAAWAALRPRYDNKRDLIVEVMQRNALPVFLTSLTTAVGFYSLTVSQLVPVQMLGTMAAFGTLMAYLLSMTVVPALLSMVPHRQEVGQRPSRVAAIFTLERSQGFIHRILAHRGKVLAATALLLVTSIIGVARVTIDSDFRGMFPDDNRAMTAFHWIESRMGGVGDLELVFSGAQGGSPGVVALSAEEESDLGDLQIQQAGAGLVPDEFAPMSAEDKNRLAELTAKSDAWNARRVGVSPEFLEQLGRFEERLRVEMAEPGNVMTIVTDFVSPLDTLRKINQVQNENAAVAYRVPREDDVAEESRKPQLSYDEITEDWSLIPGQSGISLVAQYYLQYESGARPGESLTTQLSADRTHFRVQGRIEQASSNEQLAAIERIGEIAREEFPAIAGTLGNPTTDRGGLSDLTVSGKTLLFARTSELFSMGFLQSMSLALLAITTLIGLVFRSWRLALVSLIPNLLPIMLPLSAFGLLGVPLDGPAILVSSVALGVCVDDTIHFLTKFVRGRAKGYSPEEALGHTVHESGAAMSITTVVLVIGFGTLLLSDFSPNFQMGALAGVMISLAWLFDFIVTTAVLSFPGVYVRANKKAPVTGTFQSSQALTA